MKVVAAQGEPDQQPKLYNDRFNNATAAKMIGTQLVARSLVGIRTAFVIGVGLGARRFTIVSIVQRSFQEGVIDSENESI